LNEASNRIESSHHHKKLNCNNSELD